MQNEKFTSAEKKQLRQLYADYKTADTKEWKNDCIQEFQENFPNLDIHILDLPEYIYSSNQLQFIEDAENSCHEVNYGYSGRGMYGDVCPSVICEDYSDFKTLSDVRTDSMGLSVVIYAQF